MTSGDTSGSSRAHSDADASALAHRVAPPLAHLRAQDGLLLEEAAERLEPR
eukprot:CAMPEP_0180033860 /NCGR_PEP_ID=MMETSP0984-20121128/29271_1 /TAXON_ID=483367 /ORGANISM="non described non described, Strain CCMP 2436" /LENGTH=50 /DNA_ID=CAMNT_0021959301 /DNA_START=80 /DNA_END=229 /DNA_ORIENTATION=+